MKNTWQRETINTYVYTTDIENPNQPGLFYGWIKNFDFGRKNLVEFDGYIGDGNNPEEIPELSNEDLIKMIKDVFFRLANR